MFNAGIQAFKTGQKIVNIMYLENYYEQLKNISYQINSIINENNINLKPNQMMMQQQMMMEQNNMNQQMFYEQDKPKINITFKNQIGNVRNITVEWGTTIEEVLNQYIQKYHGTTNKKFNFLYNARRVNRKEQTTAENFFAIGGRFNSNPIILVSEIN